MSLIALAVFDEDAFDSNGEQGNSRTWMTTACLSSLRHTVDWARHRLVVVSNGSCPSTVDAIKFFIDVIPNSRAYYLNKNIGQARALNMAWQLRRPGESCVRVDNDTYFTENNWVERLIEVASVDPTIGIVGLKRPDIETPNPNGPVGCWSKSNLVMLPHEKGDPWTVIEPCEHVLGACLLCSDLLMERIGYLYQGQFAYGVEDILHCRRAKMAGFSSCYIHGGMLSLDPEPDHKHAYQAWKDKTGAEGLKWMDGVIKEYENKTRSLYHGPNDE